MGDLNNPDRNPQSSLRKLLTDIWKRADEEKSDDRSSLRSDSSHVMSRREAMGLIGMAGLGLAVAPRLALSADSSIDLNADIVPTNEQLTERLLGGEARIGAPTGTVMKSKVEDERDDFLRYDASLDRMWRRLVEGKAVIDINGKQTQVSHLQLVNDACQKARVPLEIVFVAFKETKWWNYKKNNFAGAAGPWQFIKSTAKSCGLQVDDTCDDRTDFVKSTYAATKHLRELYDNVQGWEQGLGYSLSENDRWAFAMWSYNCSPKNVYKAFVQCGGNPERYVNLSDSQLRDNGVRRPGETKGYVPGIWGIAAALRTAFAQNTLGFTTIATGTDTVSPGQKSPADLAYELYDQESKGANGVKLTASNDKAQRLREIRALYESEAQAGVHSSKYTQGAFKVIDAQLARLANEEQREALSVRAAHPLVRQANQAYLFYGLLASNMKEMIPSKENLRRQIGNVPDYLDLIEQARSTGLTPQLEAEILREVFAFYKAAPDGDPASIGDSMQTVSERLEVLIRENPELLSE